MPYVHLTPMERGQIQALFSQGLSQRAIAGTMGRSPSTVCRELRRNHAREGVYDAACAQRRYAQARSACRRTTALSHPPLQKYLFDKMTLGWSPEQVSGRLWLDFPGESRMRVSAETIYRTLYADEKFGRPLLACLRQRRPRRRKRGQRRPTRPSIPNRIGIENRPAEVDALARYGDWEGDLLIGAEQKGAVLTLVERKSLYLLAALLPSRHAQGVASAAIELLGAMPASWRRTLTFDNGSEFAQHERMSRALEMRIFFAHAYAAQERGRNENTNGLMRQYLPKTTHFTRLVPAEIHCVVHELNNRPRKILGFRTPQEVFNQQTVALTV